jgi:GAF domain-containing protein
MNEGDFRAAVAARLVGTGDAHRALLRAIADTARAIFQARASSIFLLDDATDELVFEAVSGEGETALLGRRFPSSTGIAGWVLVTRQPLVLEDVAEDARFARELAAGTGYVPRGLMAVPLLHDERALGVLEVLDRQAPFTLADMDLLALFAGQAAVALDVLEKGRRADALLAEGPEELAVVADVAAALDSLEGPARAAGLRLLRTLVDVLEKK